MKSSTTKKRLGMLRISALRLDFQPTENLIEDTVQMYVNRLERGEKLPSLRVRFDGRNYFLEDGFHRVEAARRCAVKTLEAEIFPGTIAEMEAEFRDYLKRLRDRLQPKTAHEQDADRLAESWGSVGRRQPRKK